MNKQRLFPSITPEAPIGTAVTVIVLLVVGALLALPATALGQGTGPTATTTPDAAAATATPPVATTTPTAAAKLTLSLSTTHGPPGSSVTANATGFKPGETVDVTFNGAQVGTPTADNGGAFSLSFSVPDLGPGQYAVLAKGQSSGSAATTSYTIDQGNAALTFSPPQAAPGASLTVTGGGFQAGEAVQVMFNGAVVGSATADTKGAISVTFTVPALAPGQYGVDAKGQNSGITASAPYTIVAGAATPVPVATVAATPAPGPVQNAPAMVHDDRYFAQTGYRIDNDDIWAFFQQYGRLDTFGFPVSRQMQFLGCPVQMFQRQIIQVCPGQGAALINLLDPEIFPYTQVNGSTFPAPDATLKANTPPVSSPTYSTDINNFVQANVLDNVGGQPVNFLQTFNTLGGLTIWGAPISTAQPDPSNGGFIYQRFQRGIMHYIAGTGTESVLLADYLKAIIMNQNVPGDLAAQASGSRYFNQYCPGSAMWLCRPNDLGGTDLTFAFVNG